MPGGSLLTEIFSSKMSVTSCCLDLEYAIVDCQERDIKGSSTKVVDNDLTFVTSAVKSVCDGGGGWLVHDSNDIQAGDGTSILSSLSLVVVEVGGYLIYFRRSL